MRPTEAWEMTIPDAECRKCQGPKVGLCWAQVTGVAEADAARGVSHVGEQVRHVRTISGWLCKPSAVSSVLFVVHWRI